MVFSYRDGMQQHCCVRLLGHHGRVPRMMVFEDVLGSQNRGFVGLEQGVKWWQRSSLQKMRPPDDPKSRFSVCWSNTPRYFASLATSEKSENRGSCAGTSHPILHAITSVKCSVLVYTAVLVVL